MGVLFCFDYELVRDITLPTDRSRMCDFSEEMMSYNRSTSYVDLKSRDTSALFVDASDIRSLYNLRKKYCQN